MQLRRPRPWELALLGLMLGLLAAGTALTHLGHRSGHLLKLAGFVLLVIVNMLRLGALIDERAARRKQGQ